MTKDSSIKIEGWEDKGNKHIDVDGLQRPLPYHEIISDLAVEHSKAGDKILDVGCGIGQMCHQINLKSDNTRELHAADAYQICLDKTTAFADVHATYLIDENTFDVSNAVDGEFAVVIMSHVLEHMRNPIKAVEDALSKTQSGGHLILAVPNPARPNVLLSNITKTHYVNRGHVCTWDMSHWINFLENILELNVVSYHHDYIQIKGCNAVPTIMSLGKALGKIVPWWCFSNIAVIRKP